MCFGGGGGQRQQAQPMINVVPQNPIVKTPEPPKQADLTQYRPLQKQEYQPGVQMAGSSRRRQEGDTSVRDTRRRSLSVGLGLARGGGFNPSGGINL